MMLLANYLGVNTTFIPRYENLKMACWNLMCRIGFRCKNASTTKLSVSFIDVSIEIKG